MTRHSHSHTQGVFLPPLLQVLNDIQPFLYLEYDNATNTTRPPKSSARMAELFGDGVIWCAP